MDNFSQPAWSDLESTAFVYCKACSDLQSAKDCNLPYDFIRVLELNIANQLDELKKAALDHYDNVYDGSAEP